MPQLRHKHKGTRRKIGRKRFPNKNVKVEERAYKQARQLEDNMSVEPPTLSIVLALGVDKVSELIHSITKTDEDAFQDAWETILKDHVNTQEDIIRIAKEIYHQHGSEAITREYQEISLSEPIGRESRESGERDFTLENIIQTEPLKLDSPPKFPCQPISPKSVMVDRETLNVLKQKFPNLSYRDAIRQLVGLPPAQKKQYVWQPWEDEIIRKLYSWGGTIAIRLELPHRTIIAIRMRARTLGLKFDKFNPQTQWFTTTQIAHILGVGNHRVYDLVKTNKLKRVPAGKGGMCFYFKPEYIIDFLETQIWEYRTSSIAEQYQQYIPIKRKQWLTIEQVAKMTKCHSSTIYLYKKLKLVSCQIVHPYQPLVNLKEVEIAHKLRQAKMRQPRWKRVCKFCGSRKFVKYGRRGQNRAQYYRCQDCHHVFNINGALPGMRYPTHIIEKAVQLRLEGLSCAQIAKKLADLNKITLNKVIVWKWLHNRNIMPPTKHKAWRRDVNELAQKLQANLKIGVSYPDSSLLSICGYSDKTHLEDTQLAKRGIIKKCNNGWTLQMVPSARRL